MIRKRAKLTPEERALVALAVIRGDGMARVCAEWEISVTSANKYRRAFLQGGRDGLRTLKQPRGVHA